MGRKSAVRAAGYAAGTGVLLFVLLLVAGITTGVLPWRDSYASAPDPEHSAPVITDSAAPTPTPTAATPTPSPTPTPTVLDEELPTYTVTVTFSKGGTAIPYGMSSVVEHGSMEIVAVPDEGYAVEEMIVDGVSLGAVSSFVLEDVTGNHSVYIVFARNLFAPSSPTPTPEPTPEELPDENGLYG